MSASATRIGIAAWGPRRERQPGATIARILSHRTLAGWIEVVETLNRFQSGAMWRCHGVPKGVRDKFYDMTEGAGDGDRKWTVHRPMAMNRPTWSPEERNEKAKEYGGSRQNIDDKPAISRSSE
jgi:hypothetical protein